LRGRAVTVRLWVGEDDGSFLESAIGMFEAARGVDRPVLVERNEVPGYDTMGSMDARFAIAEGYLGCIADGPVRDVAGMRALGFPVFATGVSPACISLADLPPGMTIRVERPAEVEIAGVRVREGDLVLGDDVGVVVLPPEAAALLDVESAEERPRALVREHGSTLTRGGGAVGAPETLARLRRLEVAHLSDACRGLGVECRVGGAWPDGREPLPRADSIVMAEEDGWIELRATDANAIASAAEAIVAHEKHLESELRAGRSVRDLLEAEARAADRRPRGQHRHRTLN
jgi:regulator of RNase E activity RraA